MMQTTAPPSSTALLSSNTTSSHADDQSTQKSIGIIIPPPSLKRTIEVTADHVSKNGVHFEKKLLSSDNASTFNFLLPENPYHKYYKHVLDKKFKKLEEEFMDEDNVEDEADAEEGLIKSEKMGDINIGNISKGASVTFHLNRSREKPTKDPFEYFYDTTIPSSVKAFELDVIKLTAQYVAMNGKQFQFEIASAESKNPQFDFLKPNHRHFHFFSKLVDIYTKVLFPDRLTPMEIQKLNQKDANNMSNNPSTQDTNQVIKVKDEDHIYKYLNLFANPENKLAVLDLLFQKAEWEMMQEEKQRREQLEKDEKSVFDMIDWNDFIVVETIDFDEDVNEIEIEEEEAAEDETMDEYVDLYNPEEEEEAHLDERMIMTENDQEQQQYHEEEVELEEETPMFPAGFMDEGIAHSKQTQRVPRTPSSIVTQHEEEEEEEEEIDLSKFARASYQPQKGTAAKGTTAPLMLVDRKTGELIPADKAHKHLKVSTINPQYFEQKEREKLKREKTNIAPGAEMTKIIASWNEEGSDTHITPAATGGAPSSATTGSSSSEPIIWDGYTSSLQRTASAAKAIASTTTNIRKEQPSNIVGPQIPTEYFRQEQERQQEIAQIAATLALKEVMKQAHQASFEETESKKPKYTHSSDPNTMNDDNEDEHNE
ncbi:hypothetical protein FDP41_002696 [Naegleria fowleri]|uniref:SURP motif domain-containing protein n=1 Tax=Naegleria fowleri TaxID=5763 RepID=A0A6A5BUU0_NAEFO|nr:uncharacterized protein FDP41_002696 [Naegleria fowleri]KAF0978181.1 hypothetical protein FDP41_002696 [Naegleria fowleri]CAG4712392.1 unnamed protein product [Naegleria fowleri]